jgi:hypothetical protein
MVNEVIGFFELDVFNENKHIYRNNVVLLGQPSGVNERMLFELNIHSLQLAFEQSKQEIIRKLSLLNGEEKDRLDEALNCYINGCNYSAVAMAVSAIEFRLYSLMMLANPDPKLEKLPLGALIDEYLRNKQKFRSVIPEKHEHLLNYANTYRIFSVHPKKEKITRLIANSIICMTFSFLFDEQLKNRAESKTTNA